MIRKFKINLEEKIPHAEKNAFLLAVSGGVDSMTMLSLFEQASFRFSVGHCNFGLRGEESDADEHLVLQYCQTRNIPCYFTRFDTENYRQQHKLSIQEAARILRYKWLQETASLHGLSYIATGHNQNDNVETFFINLLRKTGIEGLCGIPFQNKQTIRPLLWAKRSDIVAYAREHQIPFRTDSSNHADYYMRNAIRHRISPVLDEIRQNSTAQITESMHALQATRALLEEFITREEARCIIEEDDETQIDLSKINEFTHANELLFHILKKRGFKASVIQDMLQAKPLQCGAKIFSGKRILYKDRDMLILPKQQTNKQTNSTAQTRIYENTGETTQPIHLKLSRLTNYTIENNPNKAYLDASRIIYPLTIRLWKQGDLFCPLGMENKKKKVSDFLIDRKISLPKKSQIHLIENGNGDILWIIGERTDNRYRITPASREVLLIEKQ